MLAFGIQAALAGTAGAGGSSPASLLDGLAAEWEAFTGSVARRLSDTAQAVADMPDLDLTPTVIRGRRSCPIPAPGRSADCAAAALRLCNEQGFLSGQELDIESGQVCRGTQLGLWGGQPGTPCKSKNWITEAVCW
ncbi:hypothetical protein ABID82_003400 [Methylobacterium sp. PvP062]|nr:hypothetical protein KHHGKMAE_0548 [Methylobacterium persicinum]